MKLKVQLLSLTLVTVVTYVAYCAARITTVPSHASWFCSVDLWQLIGNSMMSLAYGAFFIVLLSLPPYMFLLAPSVICSIVCAIYYKPKPLHRRLLILIVPLLASLPMAIWGAYVSLTRKHITVNYSDHVRWTCEILRIFWQASFIPIALIGAYFLLNKDCKEERLFALCVLILDGCLMFLQFIAASMPTSNKWL